MRKFLVATIVAISATVAAALPGIESDALVDHIRFLASDDMKGRGNGTPELERAAEYVAAQFKKAGLRPGGRNDSYFQPFELIAGLTVGRENSLTIQSGGRAAAFSLGTSYYPLAAPANENPAVASTTLIEVPLVFAGYGLVAPNVGYDDYEKIDVSGKAVLIFSHEPQERDANSRLNGTRPMPQTTVQGKAAAARAKGARALIVVSDPVHETDEANYKLFGLDPDAETVSIPVLRVRRDEMRPLLDAWKLEAVAKQIDADLVPRSRVLDGATVDYVEHLARNRRTVRNVVAVLPGSDPAKAGEAVVLGAHYDHVGIGGRLSVSPERTGEIHNGADDNASGTAAIIEIARSAAGERARFPRTLVFVAFAGEERGLLGSAHYATDPAVPIANTVAMLNLDMVGRARGGQRSRDPAPGPRRGAQRRLVVHRPPDPGDQLLHRVPQRLPPPRRRLGQDRRRRHQARRDTRLRAGRTSGVETGPARVHSAHTLTTGGCGPVQAQPRRERAEPLAQHQPAAVQPRLQRLILHLQPGAGFDGAEPLDVAQHDRRPIDLGQLLERQRHRLPQLQAQQRLVRHARPVGRLPRRAPLPGRRHGRLRVVALALGRPCGLLHPQPGHRRVERDPVDPRRERGVAAEPVDLSTHLEQHVLRDLLGVLAVLHVSEGQLVDPGAILFGQLLDRPFVTGLEAGHQLPILGPVHGGCSSWVEHRPYWSYSRGC